MILLYWKTAIRQLYKHKVHYLFAVISIAVGLVCFSLINYYIQDVFKDLTDWPHNDRIADVYIRSLRNSEPSAAIPGEQLLYLQSNPVVGIEEIAIAEKEYNVNITVDKGNAQEEAFLCNIYKINTGYLSVFSITSIHNRKVELHQGEVLISGKFAKKVFPKENPIGKKIYYTPSGMGTTSTTHYTIKEVVKDLPIYDLGAPDIYFLQTEWVDANKIYNKSVSVLLAKGSTSKQINNRLKSQMPNLDLQESTYLSIETYPERIRRPENIFFRLLIPLFGSFILIIAMINFIKLTITFFYNRTQELSIRKSLGAGNKEVFFLLFSEVLLVLLMAGVLTFVFTELFLPLFYLLHPRGKNVLSVQTSVLFLQQFRYLFILVFLSGLICVYITYKISKQDLIRGIVSKGRRHRMRNLFLGIQIFICFLAVGSTLGFTLLSLDHTKIANDVLTKAEQKRIWEINLTYAQFKGHEEAIVNRIRNIAGVEDILFYSNESIEYITPEGENLQVNVVRATSNYSQFMNLSIQGQQPYGKDEVLISQSFKVHLLQEGVSVDMITVGNKTYQVTGEYNSLPFQSVYSKEKVEKGETYPLSMITWEEEANLESFYVKCSPNYEKQVKKQIFQIVEDYLPSSIPFEILSMEEKNYMNNLHFLIRNIFWILTCLLLIIITFSLYSAITVDTLTRQKEVAIRKIHGAGHTAIIWLFGKLYIGLLSVTILPSFLFLYLFFSLLGLGKWLNTPFFWLANLIVVIGLIIATVGYRILQVCYVNPSESLKTKV